jgi:hypothetical protein
MHMRRRIHNKRGNTPKDVNCSLSLSLSLSLSVCLYIQRVCVYMHVCINAGSTDHQARLSGFQHVPALSFRTPWALVYTDPGSALVYTDLRPGSVL